MEMNLPVIKLETRNLTKKFSATEGVADISLQVYEHELLTLLGPSGCGKTTILRAIGGFNKIDSGKDFAGRRRSTGPAARKAAHRYGIPELQPVAAYDHLREYGIRPEASQNAQKRDGRADRGDAGTCKNERQRKEIPHSAFRRPAAACGHCTRTGAQARRTSAGRAVFGAGRQDPRARCARSSSASSARPG